MPSPGLFPGKLEDVKIFLESPLDSEGNPLKTNLEDTFTVFSNNKCYWCGDVELVRRAHNSVPRLPDDCDNFDVVITDLEGNKKEIAEKILSVVDLSDLKLKSIIQLHKALGELPFTIENVNRLAAIELWNALEEIYVDVEIRPMPGEAPKPQPATRLTPTPKPVASKPKPAQEPKKEKKKSGCGIFIILIVLAILGFAVWFFFLRGGSDSKDSYDYDDEYVILDDEESYGSTSVDSASDAAKQVKASVAKYVKEWNSIEKELKALGSPEKFASANSSKSPSDIRSAANDKYEALRKKANALYEKIRDTANAKYEQIKKEANAKYEKGELEYSDYYDIQSEAYSAYYDIQSDAYSKYYDIQSDAYSWYFDVCSATY